MARLALTPFRNRTVASMLTAAWRRFPVRILLDVYNLLNNNPVEAMNWASGSRFIRPTTMPGPMIARFGARVDW